MSANAAAALVGRAREGLRRAYLTAQLVGTFPEECRFTVDHLAAEVRHGLCLQEHDRVLLHLVACDACRSRRDDLTARNAGLNGEPDRIGMVG